MTSAKVLNWGSVGQVAGADVAGRTKAEDPQMSVLFASLMNGNYAAAPDSQTTQPESAQPMSRDNSFERYSYKDNRIEPAKEATMDDKLADAGEELEDFGEEAIRTVAEDLGVDETDVTAALENLGMTAFDLLLPQNLAQVAAELTGEQNPTELLMSADFVDLMQDMSQMGGALLETLDMQPDQLTELVAQMDILENPIELVDAPELGAMVEKAGEGYTAPTEQAEQTVQTVQTAAGQPLMQPQNEAPQEAERIPEAKEQTPENAVQQTKEPQQTAEEETGGEQTGKEPEGSSRTAHAPLEAKGNTPVQDAPITYQVAEAAVETTPPETSEASYLSIDTMDLIEQIAENVRVNISEGTTSMEMQLNPENLGKLYLQVSAKEGVVNASITASNEAVRAALEAQVADLRQSLSQAGVKVDAIEVTVASHEFEKNLEQNAGGEKRQGEQQAEEGGSQRRNINLSSMDELSGVMTEEEALAAQIMRDNGNTVDLTA